MGPFGPGFGNPIGLNGFNASDLGEELAAAPVFGARTFKVRTFGRLPSEAIVGGSLVSTKDLGPSIIGGLHGSFMELYRWGAGINEAQCLVGHSQFSMEPIYQNMHKHEVAVKKECTCGFWAYTGEQRPGTTDVVWAIIQAWGRMVVGPLGFRAQFAQIRALAFPLLTVEGKPRPVPMFDSSHYPEDVEHCDDTTTLDSAIRINYPGADHFNSLAKMTAEYPVTDLTRFLPEPMEEGS